MEDETEDSLAARVAREVPSDKLARAVARSKIAAALFAKQEVVAIGRYHLLEQVGAGGMGVVWGAWDPELERRVAIKVVRQDLASARERIVREAQALAKLSDPHVVPIYDVGVVDEQVYLVMEWVRGQTLRAWAPAHEPLEIIRAYRDAAMGLAAAHAVGLVHRDFKPENAMIGDDGRVRVLDFGLAREDGTGDVAGTPRFMAPEQTKGEVTPAVDQYALGVALREALGEPPKWVAAIITRATAQAPSERFPSMTALVDALGRDPARVLRKRLAIGGAVGLAALGFAIGLNASDSEARCSGGSAEIAADWNATSRAGVAEHLRSLGPYGVELAEHIGTELDDYAKQWVTARTAACRANDRGELTPALYQTTLACLTRAKISLTTARDVLTTTTRERLPNAVVAVRSLPAADRCAFETRPPPAAIAKQVTAIRNDIARARVLALAIDPRAIDAAATAAHAADALGDAQLVGHASLVHGLALLLQQQRTPASTAFVHATAAALEAADHATAIEALARNLYAIASANRVLPTADATLASLPTALSIAKGLAKTEPFVLALFDNNLGTLRLSREDRPGARAWFEAADRARPPASRETFELASIPGNLGLVEKDRARRDALFDREGDELEAALGPDHPLTLDARIKAAMFVEDATRSAELLRDPCDRYVRMHPHLDERITQCAYEVAWLAEARGDTAEARKWLDAIKDPKSPEDEIAVGYRALLDGKPADALAAMTTEIEKLSAASHFWRRWRAVDARIVAALAAQATGDHAMVVKQCEAAIATIDGLGEFAASTFVQRRRDRLVQLSSYSR